ncbi:VNG_1110C family protein [Salinarchaeum laminariae]|uniref:VNG_1110C family protein n=1 Tax=Salinarchaeum laminariae TaxID=869888 RepID=UPI0020BDF647|nr:hypothetical protein [Salinarchaeum laminariae]
MSAPSTFRDSTQIVLPVETLEGFCAEIESKFTVTIVDDGPCRIVGSPVEIKKASDFLARNGVTIP